MGRGFSEFLERERVLTPGQLERVRSLANRVREPIGSIAFIYGLLSAEDVDLILCEQRKDRRQFGEIAASMGMLSRPQVEALVRVQHVRRASETAEALVLAGLSSPEAVFAALGRFLCEEAAGVARAA